MTQLTPLSFPQCESDPADDRGAFPFAAAGSSGAVHAPESSGANRMQQLEAMLAEVQGRAEIVEKEAYDKAYLAGEKAGMALGRKRAEQTLEELNQSLGSAEDSLQAMQASFAEAAMDVAGYIARALVGDVLEQEPAKLWAIAREAAGQLPDTDGLRIAVSPDDYASFKRLMADEGSMLPLASDPAVADGTCRILSSQQDILVDPVAAVDDYLQQLRPRLIESGSAQPAPSPDGPAQ